MRSVSALRRPPEPPNDLHEHAAADLRFIRSTLERATGLTAFPGRGQVIIGITALGAAALATRVHSRDVWLALWIGEAALAIVIGMTAMALKARQAREPLFTAAWRRFALTFSLPIAAAAALTPALHLAGANALLPGLWLLLYGVAVAAGGAFSVPIVRATGFAFMGTGLLALVTPAAWGNAWLAFGFGGLHVVFGLAIARRHGG